MQPENAIIGDETGVDLPEAQPSDEAVAEVRSKAKYSRSKEYTELKEKLEARIKYYQQYLPSGVPIGALTQKDASAHWPLACVVITELQQIIDLYENAKELEKEIAEQLK